MLQIRQHVTDVAAVSQAAETEPQQAAWMQYDIDRPPRPAATPMTDVVLTHLKREGGRLDDRDRLDRA